MLKIWAVGYPWPSILVDRNVWLESEMSEFNLRGDRFSDVGLWERWSKCIARKVMEDEEAWSFKVKV